MARDPIRQGRDLWRYLAPRQWPVPPEALPPGSALVGGAVRDGLLGRLAARPDLDLVVRGDAIALARQLQGRLGGSCVVLDPDRSIARLVLHGWTIDLARQVGTSLEADLARRDYTVNAIALPLPQEGGEPPQGLVDPQGGLADLAAGRLRAISEANLIDDPLRLLRGVRLATELDFAIAPATWAWILRHQARIGTIAGERVLTELERLAGLPGGERGLSRAVEAGLLLPWTEEGIPRGNPGNGAPRFDAAYGLATLVQLDLERADLCGLSREEADWALPLARLAAVLDGAALARLHASRRLQQGCQRLRRWQQRLQPPGATAPQPLESLSEPERLELQRDLAGDLPALLLHLEPAQAQAALGRWRDPSDPLFHPRSPLDGATLQQRLGLAPGPRLGKLLAHLERERAFGRLPASAASNEQALTFARRWLDGGGLRHD